MDPRYAFLLDLIPLTGEVARENPVLGGTLHAVALEWMLEEKSPKERLALLLTLAADLGYTGQDVARFLLRELERVSG